MDLQKGIEYPGISIIFFCHDGKGNFVMNKRNQNCRDEQGKWEIGGGALDFGDSIEETLKREVGEEYGTTVESFEFLGYRDVHRELEDGRKTHWVTLDFAVLVDARKVKNGEPHKFDAVEWFTFKNLPSPVHSQFPFFLKNYQHRLT